MFHITIRLKAGHHLYYKKEIIIVGRCLQPEIHSGLRILSKRAAEEDVKKFIQETMDLTEPGDRNNVDAVL